MPPCAGLRNDTEKRGKRGIGAKVVAGARRRGTARAELAVTERRREWPNPFGDGHVSKRIAKVLDEMLGGRAELPEGGPLIENP